MLSHSHLLQLLDFIPPRSITFRDEEQADKDVLIIHPQADNDRLCGEFTLSSPLFPLFFPPYRQVVNAKKKIKKKRYINSGTVSLSSCSCSSTPSLLHSTRSSFTFFFFNQVFLTFSNSAKYFRHAPTLVACRTGADSSSQVVFNGSAARRIYEEYLSAAINEP